jgi:MoaA/NifB/PqqE/SkfB family radical SAM enzyme
MSRQKEMTPGTLVLAQHPKHGWLLINRSTYESVEITSEQKERLPFEGILRRSAQTGYTSAYFELIKACNLACGHCYLGGTTADKLTLSQKKSILDFIESQGIIWLNLTGGEPLLDPDFLEVYAYAWDLGLIITVMSNGLLLEHDDMIDLFTRKPPYYLSLSLYGASEKTYRRVTNRSGGWSTIRSSLRKAEAAGIRLAVKVLESKENMHEMAAMIALAERYGFQEIMRDMIPTVEGNLAPLQLRCTEREPMEHFSECLAGSQSFFVTAHGTVCPCAITQDLAIPIRDFARLPAIASESLMLPDDCKECPSFTRCGICPPRFRLLTRQGSLSCPEKVQP